MRSQHHQYPLEQYHNYHQQQLHPPPPGSPGDRVSHLTVGSTVSADYFSDNTGSTGLTSPSLASPKYAWGAKRLSHHSLGDIAEALETRPLGLSPPPPTSYATTFGEHESSTMYAAPNFEVHHHSRPTSFHSHQAEFVSTDAPSQITTYSQDAPIPLRHEMEYSSHDYDDDPNPGLAPAPEDVRRGPSVRSRASQYEASIDHSQPLSAMDHDQETNQGYSLSLPPHPADRPRSSSPRLRLPPSPAASHFSDNAAPPPRALPFTPGQLVNSGYQTYTQPRALPCPPSPTQNRQIPNTERPAAKYGHYDHSDEHNGSPVSLKRGTGTARRMIAAWENGMPETVEPVGVSTSPRSSFENNLLPPASSMVPLGWSRSRSPVGGVTVPSPLGNNTPLVPGSPPSLNTSTWSQGSAGKKRKNRDLSPGPTADHKKTSPLRSPFKRSPFKGIANAFHGLRNKTKSKDTDHLVPGDNRDKRRSINLDQDSDWFAQPKPVNSVPTGLSGDRMGENEMHNEFVDANAVRNSAIIYLVPRSDIPHLWDSWVTCWGTLTPDSLNIISCPVRRHTDSPVSRVTMNLATSYSAIPHPELGAPPLVQLSMLDCVEVRSLRKDEVRGRRIPAAPEGVGSEVLEMAFVDGTKQYIGVEGVAGRLGWVSAIWDVVLAAKEGKNVVLPPPSPSLSGLAANRLNPLPMPQGSHPVPAQIMGEQWIKSGKFVGESSSVQTTPDLSNGPQPRSRFSSMDEHYEAERRGRMDPGLPVPDTPSAMEIDEPQYHMAPPPVPPLPRLLEHEHDMAEPTALDFDPIDDMPRPQCTLPLNVQKRSAPNSPNMVSPPPLPPKKLSIVEDRRKQYSKGGLNTPPSVRRKQVPVESEEPKTPERRLTLTMPRTEPHGLRESVVKMFDDQPSQNCPASEEQQRRLRSKAMEDRIRAWQPKGGDVPAPLSRNTSTRDQESMLSFDDSDLNPSRSASQVRRDTATRTTSGTTSQDLTGGLQPLAHLGLAIRNTRNLPALPPPTRKEAPKMDEELARFQQATIEEVPKDEVRRFTVREMPRPSRVLAGRDPKADASKPGSATSSTGGPRGPRGPGTSVPKASGRSLSPPSRPGSALPKVSSAPRSPPSRPGSTLPKVSSAPRSPESRPGSALPKVSSTNLSPPSGPGSALPKVSSAPRSPPSRPGSTLPKVASAPRSPAAESAPTLVAQTQAPFKVPRAAAASTTSISTASTAPPIPAKDPAWLKSTPTTPSRHLLPPVDTTPRPPPASPRTQSRVLAAAAMFEQKNINSPLPPTPSPTRKAVPKLEEEASKVESAEAATKIGATSALATGTRLDFTGVGPQKAFPFPKVATPPLSAVSISTRMSASTTPSRTVLTPAKLEVNTPKADINASPYSAARAALRPASSRTEVGDKAPFAKRDFARPTGLFVVNKTPEGSVLSSGATDENIPPKVDDTRAFEAASEVSATSTVSSRAGSKVDRASVVSSVIGFKLGGSLAGSKLAVAQSAIASPSALGWKSIAPLTDLDKTEIATEVRSSALNRPIGKVQSPFLTGQSAQAPSALSVPSASPISGEADRSSDPPGTETWFRDQASCGEAESQHDGSAADGWDQAEWSPSPALMERLDDHTSAHNMLSRQVNGVSNDVTNVTVGISTLIGMVQEQRRRDQPLNGEMVERFEDLGTRIGGVQEAVQAIPGEDMRLRLETLGTDVQGVHALVQESATQLAALTAAHEAVLASAEAAEAEKDLPVPPQDGAEPAEPKIPEVHAKLDAIAHLIQEVLSRQNDLAAATAAIGTAGVTIAAAKEAAPEPAEAKPEAKPDAAKEKTETPKAVAMPEAPSAATPTPKDAPTDAPADAESAPAAPAPGPDLATAAQLDEVQGALKELEAARAVQTKQTADIAKYLADLNGWLEKFVQTSGTELEGMSRKIGNLVGDPGEDEAPTGLVADIHTMLSEQTQQVNIAALQAQRLDSLLGFMGADRERHSQQQGMIEQILAAANQQREDTANLLSAIAVDLTNEIKGERVRFIDSMRDATSMNMEIHVDEFKKALTTETQRSLKELGQMREQKKALEHQIADLFALKAKHGDEPPSPAPDYPPPQQAPATPATPAPRALPMPPSY